MGEEDSRNRLRRGWRALLSTPRSVRALLRHPRRVTCLDCGLLALDGGEVTDASRVEMLSSRSMGPDRTRLWCRRHLWIAYELTYAAGDWDAATDELEMTRRGCVGFFGYEAGRSPEEHFDLAARARERGADRRDKLLFFLLGVVVALLLPWLSARIGL